MSSSFIERIGDHHAARVGNNIEILSTDSGATGALPVPADPTAASNCAALWAALPPFSGSFPASMANSGSP